LDESKRNAYFKDLTLSKLPSNCTEGWDRTRQTSFYPFPTNSMSLQPPLDGGNIGWSEAAIANFISSKGMQHFYELLPGNSSIAEGLMTAVPIDIVSYFVEVNNDGMNPSKNLMAAIYSENQVVAPRTKV